MIASSPVHLHDPSSANLVQSHSVEVHQYFQHTSAGLPSWNEYSPLTNSLSSADQAPFQQLLDSFGHDSTADDDDDDEDDDTVVSIDESSSSLTQRHPSYRSSGSRLHGGGSSRGGASRGGSRLAYPCASTDRRNMNNLRLNNALPVL